MLWAAPADGDERRGIPGATGETFLVPGQALALDDPAQFQWIGWDGVRAHAIEVPGAHTDVELLPDGSVATLGWVLREYSDGDRTRRILGDSLVEVAPDGQARLVWDIFDDFQPDLSRDYPTGWVPKDPTAEDWSHTNGLSYSPEVDTYYLSITGINLVAAIDRASGALLWSTGGPDASVLAPPELIQSPHSIERLPDGDLLVFSRTVETCSHVDTFAVDTKAGTAEGHWSYTSPDCLHVGYLGDARGTHDGKYLISWSSAGRLSLVDEAGVEQVQVNAPLDWTFGFVEALDGWPGFEQIP